MVLRVFKECPANESKEQGGIPVLNGCASSDHFREWSESGVTG